jgi:hypothetical protein
VPALGACVYAAEARIPAAAPSRPKLVVKPDDLSNLWAATATVSGPAPVSVAFAVRRHGARTWQRLDVDTSPPFRGFIDPARFRSGVQLDVVAIARSLDGRLAVSSVVPFRVRAH